jgi:micrococcal nuclease
VYQYEAEVIRIIDGDTILLEVDLGYHLKFRDHFRLMGIDTPERGTAGYLPAKHRLEQLAPVGSAVVVDSYKGDKYGRWLAIIHPDTGPTVNATLVEEGFAKPYFGGAKS